MTIKLDGTTGITYPDLKEQSIAYGGQPAFSVWHSTVQSIPQSAITRIPLQTEEYDYGGCFNNTANTVTLNGLSVPPYAFCPNVPGIYRFTAAARIASTQTQVETYLRKNGTAVKTGTAAATMSGGQVSGDIYLNGVGDYVDFAILQGAAAQNLSAAKSSTYLDGHFVRSA